MNLKNEKKNRVVIHTGLPRCGSTFLQKQIFPKLENVSVFGANTIPFDFKTKLSDRNLNMISDESLSGVSATLRPYDTGCNIAKSLQKLYPNAKIIVVFRNKQKWIKSLYAQYIKLGGIEPYEKWHHCFENSNSNLDFDEYKTCLKDLFSNVLCCEFEKLKQDSKGFVNEICDFIGVKTPKYENKAYNIRLNESSMNRWRQLNKLFMSYSNPPGILPRSFNPIHLFKYNKKR